MKCSLLYLIFVILFSTNESASILVVAPFFGSAHIKIMETITQTLHDRGHNITIITTKILKDSPQNYRQIKVEKNLELENADHSREPEFSHFSILNIVWNAAIPAMKFILNSPEIEDFIKHDNSKFDLIINEIFFQEFGYAFSLKYNAPIVGIDTTIMLNHIGNFMGNSMPLNYVSHEILKYDINSFYGKIENILLATYDRLGRKYFYLPMVDKVINEHFSSWNITFPKVEEMQNQVALTLVNSHFSFDTVVPLVPGVVQIGGIHLQPANPLSEDLKAFLDNSEEGAIFFSLGSVWNTEYLGEERLSVFIDAFKKLKQRIVWKFDGNIPKMENVLVEKWFPQNDILAHPNIKVFISHGGMLSSQEAMYHGKPIIGIPIFWDQYSNIYKLKQLGCALKLDYLTLNTENIIEAVREVFNNPEYTNNAKKISSRFRDRLNDPKELAVYWIEYVIKHKELNFLKPPVFDMSFFEYYLIEIIIILFTVLCTLITFFLLKNKFKPKPMNTSQQKCQTEKNKMKKK